MPKPPLLLVHGAWQGPWCWERGFVDACVAAGFETHTVTLRGHGPDRAAMSRWHSMSDYVADVAEVAQTLTAPPIVVGHSMGGAVAQLYAARHPTAGLALLAPPPRHGVAKLTLKLLLRYPLIVLEAIVRMTLAPVLRSFRRAKALMFSPTMSDGEAREHHQKMQSESYRAFLDMLLLDRPKPVRVPVLLLAAENDRLFPPKDLHSLAAANHTTVEVFPDMAHHMPLDTGWERVAARVTEWAALL